MKTLHIFILSIAAIIPVWGQGVRAEYAYENPPPKLNTLYFKTSLGSISSQFSVGITPIMLEYDRRLTKYCSLTGGFAFTTSNGVALWPVKVLYSINSYSLSTKIAFSTNRDRRFFIRFETGFEAVFIDPIRHETEKITRFLPSLTGELYLGIKLGRNVELLLSPYLSKFRYSPRHAVAGEDDQYVEFFFYSAGVGIRF